MLTESFDRATTENLSGRDKQVPAVKDCRFTQTAFGTVVHDSSGKWLGQYETEDAAVEMLREMAKDDGGSINRAIKRIVDAHNAEEEVEAKKEKRKPIMLPRFSCHIFRHTFASRICENETNVKIIQQLMGHADVSTTMNIYAEVNAESTRESIENLAKNLDVF